MQYLLSDPALQFDLLWPHFSGFLVSMGPPPDFVRYALLDLLDQLPDGASSERLRSQARERALTGFAPIRVFFFPGYGFKQSLHILGMLFLFGENAFHQPPAGWVVVGKVSDDFRIGFNGDPFRDQILANHVDQAFAFHIF